MERLRGWLASHRVQAAAAAAAAIILALCLGVFFVGGSSPDGKADAAGSDASVAASGGDGADERGEALLPTAKKAARPPRLPRANPPLLIPNPEARVPPAQTLEIPILETLETAVPTPALPATPETLAVPTSRANLLTSIRGNSTPHRSGCPTW